MNFAQRSTADLLAKAAINYAETLVMAAEPRKALTFLDTCVPISAENNHALLALRNRIEHRIKHAFNDAEYVKRYSSYESGGNGEPFTDHGLLNLPRARIALSLIQARKPRYILTIGAGDGTLTKAILESHKDCNVFISELQESSSNVVAKLQELFPNRVHQVARYDVGTWEPEESFDFVECLEVLEHVESPINLLRNIRNVMTDDGMALITTPNSVDWVEMCLLEGDNMLHHISAFTGADLTDLVVGEGFKPVILQGFGTLYAMLTKGPVNLTKEDFKVQADFCDMQFSVVTDGFKQFGGV